MSSETTQYYKDRLKLAFYNRITGKKKKIKTAMQSALLQLDLKGLFPANAKAIELFGMHGLWHTTDYIRYVDSLAIFEINKKYHELSKKVLKKYPVTFHHADSLKYAAETADRYNFVVADTPYGGDFHDPDGLPVFFDDLVRICLPGGVIIFNIHSDQLHRFKTIEALISQKLGARKLKDLFFTPRNQSVSYIVLALA